MMHEELVCSLGKSTNIREQFVSLGIGEERESRVKYKPEVLLSREAQALQAGHAKVLFLSSREREHGPQVSKVILHGIESSPVLTARDIHVVENRSKETGSALLKRHSYSQLSLPDAPRQIVGSSMTMIHLKRGASPIDWASELLRQQTHGLGAADREKTTVRFAEFLATRLGISRQPKVLEDYTLFISKSVIDTLIREIKVSDPGFLPTKAADGIEMLAIPKWDSRRTSSRLQSTELSVMHGASSRITNPSLSQKDVFELKTLTSWQSAMGKGLVAIEPTRINLLKRIVNWLASLFNCVVFSRTDSIVSNSKRALSQDPDFVRALCNARVVDVSNGIDAYIRIQHGNLTGP